MRRAEETKLTAQALGMDEAAIARYDAVARAMGPRMLLDNSTVYDAAWEVRLGYLKRGESFPPDRVLIWAIRIWLVLVQSSAIDTAEAPFVMQIIRDVAKELWEEL